MPALPFLSLLRTVLTSEALKVFYLFKNKGRVVYNARGMGDLSAQDKCPECPSLAIADMLIKKLKLK